MPCMGPSYNKQEADAAYKDIVLLLKEKYKLFEFNALDLHFDGMHVSRRMILDRLRRDIHDCFFQNEVELF